jgi:hypothetical protein
MSQELHYTSVPRGLKPGSRGFCTVAMTPQIPGPLVERLEGLSGYQPVYPPHDPAAALNPVNFAHVRFSLGGRPVSILSRVGPAGLDYTGRTNKYAHHVVLDVSERPDGGPAWLLGQPGFMQSALDGEPRMLDEGRPVPGGDRPGGIATAWATLTGDAGWAGALAEVFLTDPKRSAFVVFRPGMDLLPLFAEAIALLPPSRRWEVEFSTYLTQAARGITYAWRGVLEDSPEASNASRLPGALVIDLCRAPRQAEGGPLVHTARTGEHREWTARPAASVREFGAQAPRSAAIAEALPRGESASQQGNYELIPELAARMSFGKRSSPEGIGSSRGDRRRTGMLVAWIAAACVVPLVVGGFFMRDHIMQLVGLRRDVLDKVADNQKIVAEKKEQSEKAQAQKDKPTPPVSAEPTDPAPKPKATPTVAPEPAGTTKQPEKHKPAVISSQPVNQVKPSTTVKPLFCRLEEQVSGLGGINTQQPIKLDNSGFVIQRMELLGSKDLDQERVAAGPELTIFTKVSGLQDARPKKLATFHVSATGTIEFAWAPISPDELRTERDSLRDSILAIHSKDNRTQYCILRDKPSAPKGVQEFQERLESKSTRQFTYTFYNWDYNNIYNKQSSKLRLADCTLQGGDGKAPGLGEKEDGTWVAESDGEDLLSVELCKVRFQRDGHVLRPFAQTRHGEIPIHRPAGNRKERTDNQETGDANAKQSDEGSVIAIRLFDNDPRTLGARIETAKRDLDEHRKARGGLKDSDKEEHARIGAEIQDLERKLKRLDHLEALFKATISLKIIWLIDEVKLEIAHLDARKLIPPTDNPLPRR